jgi:hypothetical protein
LTAQLIKYEAARQALVEAKNVFDAKAIIDEAAAIERLARSAMDGALLADAIELRMRAERKAGEFLNEMEARGEIPSQRAKEEWIAAARRDFAPSQRAPCAVCGKYASVAQAHHLTPLGAQYDIGIREALHDHVWLCPTHHAAVHIIISQYFAKRQAIGRAQIDVILDFPIEEMRVIYDIYAKMRRSP